MNNHRVRLRLEDGTLPAGGWPDRNGVNAIGFAVNEDQPFAGAFATLVIEEDRIVECDITASPQSWNALPEDLADDELVLNVEQQALLPRWDDLPDHVTLSVYTLPEIAGEELRCVLQRLQCRDLFDLSVLLTEGGVDIIDAAEIFRPKAEHRSIDPNVFAARYSERLDQYRQRWEGELGEHIPGEIPHFDNLERRVSRQLRKAGLL